MSTPPAVLMAHCYYRQRGGEDVSFEAEAALLEERGHAVTRFVRHNAEIAEQTVRGKLAVAAATVWSRSSARDLGVALRQARPDVAHFQNTFPLLSPSVYRACRDVGVPVVQSVRNYRLRCVNGLLYRDGAVCEDCVGLRAPVHGVRHACYRGSRAQSAVVAASLGVHWTRGTWDEVDVFVALTEFARAKLVEFGLPAERVVVKPNFVPDPGPRPAAEPGDGLLYVGRLSPEKGLLTLVEAVRATPGVALTVVGEGPLEAEVARRGGDRVRLLGRRGGAELAALVRGARAVVVPSQWYETFGRVVVEAYACGTPVIASDLGALAELVQPEVTGVRVAPGDVDALAAAIARAVAEPGSFARMGAAARAEYEQRYTADASHRALLAVYEQAAPAHPSAG